MSMKHTVTDSDTHFVVDPITRKIVNSSSGKTKLMQYDHNSERFTFDVPRYIENHDMSLCDVIQVHYTNTNVATSASLRKTYRGVHVVTDMAINPEDENLIAFSWLVPETATMFAGSLKFQLKFICHDNVDESIEGYKWHTEVNDSMTVTAGLEYSEDEMNPATTATLQSLEIIQLPNGVDIVLDGVHHTVYNGGGGSTGQLPEPGLGDNTKIVEVANGSYVIRYPSDSAFMTYLKSITATSIDENSTDKQYVTAKAVYALVNSILGSQVEELDALIGEGV